MSGGNPTLKHTYAPAPTTTRGEHIHVGVSPDGTKICYAAGNNIIVRGIQDPLDVFAYAEHRKQTTVAKFSPSGFYIASGDVDGYCRVWDAVGADHVLKAEIQCFSGRIDDIAWSDDSKRIMVCGDGQSAKGKVFMWDTGSNVGDITGHSKRVLSCDYKPNRPYRVVTASEDLNVNIYEGPPFRFSHQFQHHARYPNCIRFSPDGERFISVGSDMKGVVHESKEGGKIGELSDQQGHTGSIYSCSWSPDSTRLLTASADKTCKIWDMSNYTCIATVNFADKPTVSDMQVCALWTPSQLLSVSLDGHINYIDANAPERPVRVIKGHQAPVLSIDVDAKINTMVSGDVNGVINIWQLDSGCPEPVKGKGHTNAIQAVRINGSRDSIVSVGLDDTFRSADLKVAESGASLALDSQPLAMAAGNIDGGLAAVAIQGNRLVLIRNGAVVFSVQTPFQASTLAFSHDDNQLAVGAVDCKVYLHDVNGNEMKATTTLERHRGKITCVAYSPDGTMLATADANREITVWDRSNNQAKITGWQFHDGPVTSLSWSPSSARLASGSLDQHVIIWSIAKKRTRVKIESAHLLGVTAVCFYEENSVATAGHDGLIRTWGLPDAPTA